MRGRMMKATKFIVLFAGVIGVVAFFLPLIGSPGAGGWSDSALAIVRQFLVASGDARTEALSSLVLAAFAPVPACATIGLIGVISGRFGRGLGAGAVLLGGAGLAAWAILYSDISELAARLDSGGFSLRISIGMWGLLVCLAGCAAAGLLALISPDRGEDAPEPRHAATIKA